jgi:hypothetical protein
MSVSLPNGASLSIGSTYAAPTTITVATNANPAVCTATAHGFANGDFIVLTSGWSKANGRVFRLAGITANTFNLEGLDTTSTADYPAGTGIGSCKKITAWTQINQVLEFTTGGGDQQFVTYSFLEQDFETQIPTVKSPSTITMSVGDDSSLPWYAVMGAANDDRVPRALRLTLPSGALILYNGYVTMNRTPSMTKNQIMALQSTVAQTGPAVRY